MGDQQRRPVTLSRAYRACDDRGGTAANATGKRKQRDRQRKSKPHRGKRFGAEHAEVHGLGQLRDVHGQRAHGHERAQTHQVFAHRPVGKAAARALGRRLGFVCHGLLHG